MGGNGTSNNYATPYASTAIETPGTYKVVVKSGVILSADGTKEYKGGEFEFTVAERAVEVSPSAEDGFCYNDTLEDVVINIHGFVISAPDASAPGAANILTFATPSELRTYMESHKNPPITDDESFEAFSSYISTVIDYISKI